MNEDWRQNREGEGRTDEIGQHLRQQAEQNGADNDEACWPKATDDRIIAPTTVLIIPVSVDCKAPVSGITAARSKMTLQGVDSNVLATLSTGLFSALRQMAKIII